MCNLFFLTAIHMNDVVDAEKVLAERQPSVFNRNNYGVSLIF